jgi:hypothetical protein
MTKLTLWKFHRHIGLRSTLIITTLLLASSVVFGQDCTQDFTDASGEVIVRVYTGPWVYGQHNTTSVSVDSDFVLVGGGVMISQWANPDFLLGEPGALLTASYPNSNLTTWHAASKDHGTAYPHYLRAYAIGLRLSGVSSVQLRSYMVLPPPTSSSGHHPSAVASLPPGYLLVGGGARANGNPQRGLLLTASYPYSFHQWGASAKDHHFSDLGSVDAFAIGIQQSIPGFGVLSASYISASSFAQTSYGVASVQAPTGWVQSSVGGRAQYIGAGRLLTDLFPFCEPSSNRLGAKAISKDHLGPYNTAGDTYAYTVFIQKQ